MKKYSTVRPISLVSRISNFLCRKYRIIENRRFPIIRIRGKTLSRPISFVVVRFSDEIDHNILISNCVHNPLNQLIIVDNTSNIHFQNLSVAINEGIEQAENDLIVIVHEDVFFPENWQLKFEEVLQKLESNDLKWGVLGTAGLTFDDKLVGHFSDPKVYFNFFSNGETFEKVKTVDEHLMVIRKSSGLRMDSLHPGIHGIGTDLVISAQQSAMNCYVIDAPSVHKYRDATGNIISKASQSAKIVDRKNYAYIADKECCDDYISHKWAKLTPFDSPSSHYEVWKDPREEIKLIPKEIIEYLDNPIILLGKGGGGSRLLSFLVSDCGVYLGNKINYSGDCMDMVVPIYKAVITKYACKSKWQKELLIPELRLAAARMLVNMPKEKRKLWGFKLPENLFLLPELDSAFPNARYVQLFRNPLSICLRRTHMTARLDNQIGRVTLPLAYREAGLDVKKILEEDAVIHMARTTLHQLNMSVNYCRENFDHQKYTEVWFENIVANPLEVLEKISHWLNIKPSGKKLVSSIDKNRIKDSETDFPDEIKRQVEVILEPISKILDIDSLANKN